MNATAVSSIINPDYTSSLYSDTSYDNFQFPPLPPMRPLQCIIQGKYEGEYKNEKYHGKGELIDDYGNKYEGEFIIIFNIKHIIHDVI